ncbi:MAG: hypothetical protein F6K24_23510 [Okeania sp. SIO2D1]|nr:hypothetical protein [Okeania sp. SIO2D1]
MTGNVEEERIKNQEVRRKKGNLMKKIGGFIKELWKILYNFKTLFSVFIINT